MDQVKANKPIDRKKSQLIPVDTFPELRFTLIFTHWFYEMENTQLNSLTTVLEKEVETERVRNVPERRDGSSKPARR